MASWRQLRSRVEKMGSQRPMVGEGTAPGASGKQTWWESGGWVDNEEGVRRTGLGKIQRLAKAENKPTTHSPSNCAQGSFLPSWILNPAGLPNSTHGTALP